ncbi:MAG: hypothetical protein LBD23_14470 [Oscillospiraceae bacterium]|jgi:hypothetical protein|nr:hypothetical protein [Oscillospiraceae bacterium]
MTKYEFGAGGFKLGERVEILTTKQRGILIGEFIHISGCNTYQILLPSIVNDGKMRITNRDHLVLKRLEPDESLFDVQKELTDETVFSPKGTDVNAEWIRAAIDDKKEYITEVDDAVGVEEITINPGTEVWNKVYGLSMIVIYIIRDIYSKELEYGAVYMVDDREEFITARAYSLIPLENMLNIYSDGKQGAVFEDGRDNIAVKNRFTKEILGII